MKHKKIKKLCDTTENAFTVLYSIAYAYNKSEMMSPVHMYFDTFLIDPNCTSWTG
jgi:hypothetical protein